MTVILQRKKPSKDISHYSGQWVAFINQTIIASAKTLKELMEKVKQKGLEEKVSVFLVPRKDEGPYVLAVTV